MDYADFIEPIRSDQNNPELYALFSDWLQERGDPWGELIALQLALEARRGDTSIANRIEALRKTHNWAGGLKPSVLRVNWKWGLIHSIHFFHNYHSSRREIEEAAEHLLALPMAVLVKKALFFGPSRYWKKPPANVEVVTCAPAETASDDALWISATDISPDMGKYKKLVLLEYTGRAPLPPSLSQTPLEVLRCRFIENLPDVIWGMESLGFIDGYDPALASSSLLHHLLAGFIRANTPSQQRIFEAKLLHNTAPQGGRQSLLLALDSNLKLIRQRALLQLQTTLDNPLAAHPIEKGSVVTVAGSLNLDKATLKKHLKALGAALSNKVSPKTTHLLLGEGPKGKPFETSAVLLLEKHLNEYIQPLTRGPLPIDTLAQQLRSKNNEQIKAAISTLSEHATLPSELLPHLFCILQDTDLSSKGNARAKTQKLFAAYAPQILQETIATHIPHSVLLAGEYKQAQRLVALQTHAGGCIDVSKVAQILREDHDAAVKYTLENGDADACEATLRSALQGSALVLKNRGLQTLPTMENLPIQTVDLSYNRLRQIPSSLLSIQSIEVLDLSYNSIVDLPDAIATLSRLHTLNLSNNPELRHIPDALWGLPSLKSLRLSACMLLPFNRRKVKSLLQSFTKRAAGSQQRIVEARLFCGEPSGGEEAQLQLATQSNVAEVKSNAKLELSAR